MQAWSVGMCAGTSVEKCVSEMRGKGVSAHLWKDEAEDEAEEEEEGGIVNVREKRGVPMAYNMAKATFSKSWQNLDTRFLSEKTL